MRHNEIVRLWRKLNVCWWSSRSVLLLKQAVAASGLRFSSCVYLEGRTSASGIVIWACMDKWRVCTIVVKCFVLLVNCPYTLSVAKVYFRGYLGFACHHRRLLHLFSRKASAHDVTELLRTSRLSKEVIRCLYLTIWFSCWIFKITHNRGNVVSCCEILVRFHYILERLQVCLTRTWEHRWNSRAMLCRMMKRARL